MSRDGSRGLQACLAAHGRGGGDGDKYKGLSYVRTLGVPGFDARQTAGVGFSHQKSVVISCGTGGIFEVEKKGGTWQRSRFQTLP